MAYDQFIADRVKNVLTQMKVPFYEKKMFGGLCIMVDDKMCCGVMYHKKKETDLLMARIGEEASTESMQREGCHPMDFTGRPMKGYVFVTPDGFDSEADLEYWVRLCIDFNPLAIASKKRKTRN